MSRRRALLTAGAVVAAGVAAYAIAQGVMSEPTGARGVIPQAARRQALTVTALPRIAAALPSGPRVASGDPGADSAAGAVTATLAYLEVVDQAASFSGAIGRVRALTEPPFTEVALRAEAIVVSLTQALDAGGNGLFRSWRLGWRVDAYTPTAARVAIWTMGLAASSTEIVAPDWSTTTCSLHWSWSTWRVASAHTRPGPTPLSPGAGRAAVASFVRSASGFSAMNDAP